MPNDHNTSFREDKKTGLIEAIYKGGLLCSPQPE